MTPYLLTDLLQVLKFNASKFVDATIHLSSLSASIQMYTQLVESNDKASFELNEVDFRLFKANAEFLCAVLATLELPTSLIGARRVLDFINEHYDVTRARLAFNARDVQGLRDYINRLQGTMSDELSTQQMFVLPFNKVRYYESSVPHFGQEVANRFPSAAYEIDEAAKCFALNRHTASVFHLMRVMEIGISATRKALSIPDPIKPAQRNWGFILGKFDDEIKDRNKTTRWAIATDPDFFAEVYASLDAVRNVWRNATMHVEKIYTEEEADHIFAAVRGFMRKLASRVDEQGQPLA